MLGFFSVRTARCQELPLRVPPRVVKASASLSFINLRLLARAAASDLPLTVEVKRSIHDFSTSTPSLQRRKVSKSARTDPPGAVPFYIEKEGVLAVRGR